MIDFGKLDPAEYIRWKTGIYVENLGFSTALPKAPMRMCRCEYCATKHDKKECPNCGAPTKESF